MDRVSEALRLIAIAVGFLTAVACAASRRQNSPTDSDGNPGLDSAGGDQAMRDCGAGALNLYTNPDGGPIGQPAIVGDHVILSLDHSIVSVPLAGGDALTLAAIQYPTAPVVLEQMAYFQAISTPDAGPGPQSSMALDYSLPLSGSPEIPVPMTSFGAYVPAASDGTNLYLLAPAGAQVKRWTPGSNTFIDLAGATGLLVDGVAVQGDYLYLAAQDLTQSGSSNGLIARALVDGTGSFERVVVHIGHPWNLLASSDSLFWSEDPSDAGDGGSGRIATSKLDGSSPTTLSSRDPVSMALLGQVLVYSLGSQIERIPVTGGALTTVRTGVKEAGYLTPIPGPSILWVDPVSKAVSDPSLVSVTINCGVL